MFCYAICDKEEKVCQWENGILADQLKSRGISFLSDFYHCGEEILRVGNGMERYDAIFLDPCMKIDDGQDLAQWIKDRSLESHLVFVSDQVINALDGYKVGAMRFILKDDRSWEGALRECVDAMIEDICQKKATLSLDFMEGYKMLSPEQIFYVESCLHKTFYHVWDKKGQERIYSRYEKLSDVEKTLDVYGFCRTHQSYLVNMNLATNVERYEVTLPYDIRINISKKHYKKTEIRFLKMKEKRQRSSGGEFPIL